MSIKISKEQGQMMSYTFMNSHGFSVKILNLGGIIQSICLPNGQDITLGYDDLNAYKTNPFFFGAVIGPNANRISQARFSLGGVEYTLEDNDGGNNLHSGKEGLHTKYFKGSVQKDTLILSVDLAHMEGGFPGNRTIEIHYRVTEENRLSIQYHATTDQETPMNLTNHAYFNLDGHEHSCLKNWLLFQSGHFTYNNAACLPTGEIRGVIGTPLDFIYGKEIGQDIWAHDENLHNVGGYDHNFLLNPDKVMKTVVEASGKLARMRVETDCMCMQFYSGNFITAHKGKQGATYDKHSGFCIETGGYPDSLNVEGFPVSLAKPGEKWCYQTDFCFEF